MKKILFPALLVAGITFTTVGCKKETTLTADGKEIVAVDSDEDASSIIEFNNNLIEKREKRASNLKRINSYLNGIDNYMAGKTIVLIAPVGIIDAFKSVEAPDALGKNKDEVKKLVDDAKAKYDDIKKKTDELGTYIKAEDFKDDNGAKAKTLKEEIYKLMDEYNALETSLDGIMSPIADSAETVILKDHPLKEYVISNKAILNKALKLEETMNNQIASNKFDLAAFKKQYTELETLVKGNTAKEFKVEDASYSNKKGYYESFNKKAEEYLGSIRKIMREAESAGKFSDQNAQQIFDAYDGLLTGYNNFVN